MTYAHTDLLSYDDIDKEVDQIFRAFCDTTLIEYAAQRLQSADKADVAQKAYWTKVVSFRRSRLSRFDRPDFLQNAGPQNTPQSNNPAVSDDESKLVQGFLYWFDLRADYWSRHDADEKLLQMLAPAKDLGELYHKARDVQDSIQAQEPVTGMQGKGLYSPSGLHVPHLSSLFRDGPPPNGGPSPNEELPSRSQPPPNNESLSISEPPPPSKAHPRK